MLLFSLLLWLFTLHALLLFSCFCSCSCSSTCSCSCFSCSCSCCLSLLFFCSYSFSCSHFCSLALALAVIFSLLLLFCSCSCSYSYSYLFGLVLPNFLVLPHVLSLNPPFPLTLVIFLFFFLLLFLLLLFFLTTVVDVLFFSSSFSFYLGLYSLHFSFIFIVTVSWPVSRLRSPFCLFLTLPCSFCSQTSCSSTCVVFRTF